ncbi:hypothetical protein [uncultured Roseovarius sp.]|uniref:hypothetical protein n=1 Tax=uncultured Roseovarius sp. TaxID=293344 RepID=UPI0026081B2B|nr:hypothetical protein [uncultured Roseovarius sp.]
MNSIHETLMLRLNSFSRSISHGSPLTESDLDELAILHGYCQQCLSDTFNRVFSEIPRGSPKSRGAGWVDRLLRVHKVESDIPEEIKNSRITKKRGNSALIPVFQLESDDKQRIAELCEKMRKIIFSTSGFDEPHRLRLLNRIAAIEAEIHKPVGMFDVVRGGMNDLGETLGKFGKDIKPLTDRMREVVGIARKGTKEYDQLPEPEELKRLPSPDPEDDNE